MFFYLIDDSFDCFFQRIKIHPADLDVPEGPDLALIPHHTHEESDLDPGTGRLHIPVKILSILTHKSLVAC